MKKLISLLFLLALISLVACGTGNDEAEDQNDNANEGQEETEGETQENKDGEVVTIGAGAGIVEISEEVMNDENYNLDGFKLTPSSEAAMMGVIETKTKNEEPFIITGWRPHSMFAKYDLKFLEDTQEHFKYDNVYVLSYQGLEEKYPEAYEIMSQWSIKVEDLEEMMLAYENEGTPFEESAAQWIEENRDQVDQMLGK